jgi:hypothetical protein
MALRAGCQWPVLWGVFDGIVYEPIRWQIEIILKRVGFSTYCDWIGL